MTAAVALRLATVRKIIAKRMWAARSEVIRRQLMTMRGTYPA